MKTIAIFLLTFFICYNAYSNSDNSSLFGNRCYYFDDTLKIGKLIFDAPLAINGNIETFINYDFELVCRIYKVIIKKVLKGSVSTDCIYLIEPLMQDSQDSKEPAVLFNAEYLLFLEQFDSLRVKNSNIILKKLNLDNNKVFSIYHYWQGAICLDSKWSERVNLYIDIKYKINRIELKNTIEDICKYYQIKNEKEKTQFCKKINCKNLICKEFCKEVGEK